MKKPALLALTVLLFSTANAAEIYLTDGTIVIGDVLSLVDGDDLTVDTAHMDEVVIEWGAIESIRNTQIVEVETFDGRRMTGKLEYSEGELQVAGQETIQLSGSEVYAIEEFNESFTERLSAHTDLGMNIVRGNNTVTQISFGAGLGYDAERYEASVNGTTIINEQTDSEDTRRATLAANYTQKLSNRWRASGLYQFESDEQQGLNGRSLIGATLGRSIINDRTHRVNLFAGVVENFENFDGEPSEESLEAVLGSQYRLRSLADLDATLTLFPSLEESGRYRVQFDAALSFDLFSDLDFKTTVYDRYDSRPPAGNVKNDYGVTVGLSYDY